MQAQRIRFDMDDYRRQDPERQTKTVSDPDAYYKAIGDFLTTLGPNRVIGIQTPSGYGFDRRPVTDVWFWDEQPLFI